MRTAIAWAGGIGSMLALDAVRRGAREIVLVHVASARTAPAFVVEEQAAALGLPLVLGRGPEIPALTDALRDAKVERVAFGYLRGEENAGMFALSRAAREAPAEPVLPVRHTRVDEAARQLAESGSRAFVRRVAPPVSRAWLGRFLDADAVDELEAEHGRAGWASVRTLVVDGPAFSRRVDVTAQDPEPTTDGGWDLSLGLRGC